MKPQIRISLDIEDHDQPQPGDVLIGQTMLSPSGPRLYWSDVSRADWPLCAAKLEQIALLLRNRARA